MPEELQVQKKFMRRWKELADRAEGLRKEVRIVLVGKYTKLQDAYASVIKALTHAALAVNRRLSLNYINAEDLEEEMKATDPVRYHNAWKSLCQCQGKMKVLLNNIVSLLSLLLSDTTYCSIFCINLGVIIPGGFGTRGVEGKIAAAHWARTTGKPLLGVCLGLQCAVIEFARNVLSKKDAHTTEINPHTTSPVVIDMPEHNTGDLGGTMRLGKRQTIFKTEDSILRQLYGNQVGIQRHIKAI